MPVGFDVLATSLFRSISTSQAGSLNLPDQIRASWRSAPADYVDAPLVQGWRRHVIEVARKPTSVLIGTVTHHAEFSDETLIATTRVLAANESTDWVHTTRRLYRLGDRRS